MTNPTNGHRQGCPCQCMFTVSPRFRYAGCSRTNHIALLTEGCRGRGAVPAGHALVGPWNQKGTFCEVTFLCLQRKITKDLQAP